MSHFAAAFLGGVIGGALGVVGTLVSSYYGPRRLEEWRERRRDEPREKLLATMLRDPDLPIRSIDVLAHVTGTTDEECRRLLIAIGARGVLMSGRKEGWALIERFPLDRDPELSP